ncbi:hypothetical protein [Roseobacter sp.]|uniref:hypothetical protein n=1 Tax=Roseobacter sp. TaxID=1907202 RepID=UPI003298FEA1
MRNNKHQDAQPDPAAPKDISPLAAGLVAALISTGLTTVLAIKTDLPVLFLVPAFSLIGALVFIILVVWMYLRA